MPAKRWLVTCTCGWGGGSAGPVGSAELANPESGGKRANGDGEEPRCPPVAQPCSESLRFQAASNHTIGSCPLDL